MKSSPLTERNFYTLYIKALIYRHSQILTTTNNSPIKKGERSIDLFSQDDIKIANSIWNSIHHHWLSRKHKSKQITSHCENGLFKNVHCGEDMMKEASHLLLVGLLPGSTSGKLLGESSKRDLPYDLTI